MLGQLTPRTVALVASVPDLDIPTAGSEWTLGEAAAHLVVGVVDYELAVHGGPQVLVRFGDGACGIHPPELGLVDCRLSGDPVSWHPSEPQRALRKVHMHP